MRKNKPILLMLLLGISILFNGCSSRAPDMAPMEVPASESIQEETKEQVSMDRETSNVANGDSGIQFDTTSKLNRKVIKTGTINLQTKQFENTVQQIIDKVSDIGGFIENCSIQGNDLYNTYSRRSGELSVRIPNAKFDPFMNESNQFGNVTSKSIQGQDVTDQYMDTEIRLETLEIQAERLKALLAQAGDLDKLFKIEKELANVTYEIESLKGTLKKYDSLIDYSTINIYIEEAEVYVEPTHQVTFIGRMKNTFMKSVQGLIAIAQGICLIVVGILPFLIILVPIIVIAVKLLRHRENKKKHSPEHKKE